MPITRRHLLELLTSSTFFLSALPSKAFAEPAAMLDAVSFPQGVASGDPQPDAVMLWTRAEPQTAGSARVRLVLQVSGDEEFSSLLLQEAVHARIDNDYTVRAYVDGLAPDTHYYYRFVGAGESMSRTGRTRTAPAPDHGARVNLAFASCQNFEQAYFGSWARMLEEDRTADERDRIDFVLHLGDFIYERSWDRRLDGGPLSRNVPAFPDGAVSAGERDAISLADYRHLYKTYLGDPHLQAARARWPFICTWDDHEFADDNFQSFTTYGGHAVLEAQRKLDANQAWFEYIPATLDQLRQHAHDFRPRQLAEDEDTRNREAVDSLRIYRRLRWGKYLDIVITDSRSYRGEACLPPGFAESLGLPLNTVRLVAIADAGNAYADGNPPATLPYGDGTTANPARERPPGSLLGAQQRAWFLDALEGSDAPWKLWANALPLLPLRLDMSRLPFSRYEDSVYTIDNWAGFPHEVTIVMRHLEEKRIGGVVSLSGDHHMHGAADIRHSTTDADAKPVAVDFAVAGISSSPVIENLIAAARADHPDFAALVYRETDNGFEPVWNASLLDGVLAALAYGKTGSRRLASWLGPNKANPGLRFVDAAVNGYGLASFEAGELLVSLVGVEACREPFTRPPGIRYVARFRVPLWQAGDSPLLQGPEFEGSPPFPFDSSTV